MKIKAVPGGIHRPARFESAGSGIMVVAILSIWYTTILFSSAPYLHDFTEWLYQSQVLKLLVLQPESVPGYSVHAYPVPNSLVFVIMALLGAVMPPLWAGKIFLLALVSVGYVVIRRFSRRWFDENVRLPITLILLATLVFPTFFFYGFVSYQLGLLFLVLFLSLDDCRITPGRVAAFSLILFFAHGMPFLVFGLLVLIRALLLREPRLVLSLAPACLLAAWFQYGRSVSGFVAPKPDANWSSLGEALLYKAGYTGMLGPFKNLLGREGNSLFESQAWIYWAGFFCNFLVVGIVAVFCIVIMCQRRSLIRKTQHENMLSERVMYLTSLLLGAFYVLAPYDFFGLFNPGGRVLLPMLLMLLIIGKSDVGRLVRVILWPVGLFTLLTCIQYALLVIPEGAHPPPQSTPPRAPSIEAKDSVFEFNRALYANTRFDYFNYRIFVFAHRYDDLEQDRYRGLGLKAGMVQWRNPARN